MIIIERIIHLLKREIEVTEDMILSGQMADWVQYRSHVAQVAAYRHAIDLVKQADQEIDDDDLD